MAIDINNTVIGGHLTADTELKQTNNGTQILTGGIACNGYKEGEVSFFNFTVFGKLGPAIHQYMKKGKEVTLVGKLRQDRWEKDGQKHSRVIIIANDVKMHRGDSGQSQQTGQQQQNDNFGASGPSNDDIPF